MVLAVVRPRVKFWKTVWLVCSWVIIIGQGAFCVYLACKAAHRRRLSL